MYYKMKKRKMEILNKIKNHRINNIKTLFEVKYPDNEIEYWYDTISEFLSEFMRLREIHKMDITFKIINDPEILKNVE